MGSPHPVLVVDDDPDIRHSIVSLLEDEVEGVRVHASAGPEEALAFLCENPVCLIITDYRMPGMDGLEFLDQARGIQPDAPALLLTAYPDPELAAQAVRQAGVVMAKPLDLDYLVAIVVAAQDGKLRHRPVG